MPNQLTSTNRKPTPNRHAGLKPFKSPVLERSFHAVAFLALLLGLLLASGPAFAAVTTIGNLATGGSIPTNSNFTLTGTQGYVTDGLATSSTFNSLTFSGSDTVTNANQLVLSSTNGAMSITSGGTTANLLTGGTVTTGTTNVFTVNTTTANMTIGSVISGSTGLMKTGVGGTLTLTNTNNYTGTTSVGAGTLVLNSASGPAVMGDFTVYLTGTLRSLSNGQMKATSNLLLTGGVYDTTATSGTFATVTMGAGGAIVGSGSVVSLANYSLQGGNVSAVLSGTAGMSAFAGTTVLSNSNNFTGLTTVSSGMLQLNSAVGPALAGNVTINGGTMQSLLNNQIATSGSLVLNGGVFDMGINSNTLSSVTLTSGTLRIAANNTAAAQLVTTSALNAGAGSALDLTGMASTVGLYKIASGASLSGSFATVNGLASGYKLVYNTLTLGELDAQHLATLTLSATTNAANVHVGLQTVAVTIANSAPLGAALLNYTLTGISGSGTRIAAAGAAVGTGTYAAVAGTNSFNIVATDPNATNSPQSIAFSQVGYNLAGSATSQLVNIGSYHVGTGGTTALVLSNTTVAGTYSETLQTAGFSGTPAGFTAAGSAAGIAAGGTGSGTLTVGIGSNAPAGAVSGTTVLTLQSNAVNGSGLGTTTVAPQFVSITGTGYNLAAAAASQTVNVGSFHVGTGVTTALILSNTASAGTFTETLQTNGFTGISTGLVASGAASGIVGSGSGSGTLLVGTGTTAGAGIVTGTVGVALQSNAVNGSGLGTTNLAPQSVAITGTGYNLAAAAASQAVNVGNYHVGTGATTALTLTNTAPANATYTETLQTNGFTGISTGLVGSGAASGIVGSGSASGTLRVGVGATAGAGIVSGTVGVALQSAAVNNSGLGTTNLTSQSVAITGTGYNLASANTIATPVNLGNVHVGGSFTNQALSVQNTAAAGAFSEKLDAAFGANGGLATNNTGAINLLAAGSTDSATMTVGLGGNANTATSGAKAGTVTVNLTSDGNGTSGLGTTTLTAQTVSVTGGVYNLASANTIATPIGFGNVHVGGSFGTHALTVTNTAPAGAYTEKLDAAFGANGGLATNNAGAINLLAAGSTDSATMSVGLGGNANTATAGAKAGTVTVNLTSDGAGTSGLANSTLTAQTLNLSGAVYNLASANMIATPVNLGFVHVGGAFGTQALSVQNTAPTGAYSEKLDASFGVNGGLATNLAGSISLLAPQATNTSLAVGLGGAANTATAGTKTGTVTVNLTSDGAGTSGLGLTALSAQTVAVSGGVFSGKAEWNSATGGNWLPDGSWKDTQSNVLGGAPGLAGAAGDTATFGTVPANGTVTVNLNGSSPVLAGVNFNNSNASYVVAQGSGGMLTLNNGAASATLAGNAGNHTISAPITLASNLTANVTAGSVTISGPVSESGGSKTLLKSGNGTLTLTGQNTYTGTTEIDGGILQIGDGHTSGLLGGGAVIDNARLVFDRSDSITVGNLIGGTGGLTQAGSGVLTLTAQNTYSGATTVQKGTLNAGNLALSKTSPVSVDAGATLTLAGTQHLGSLAGAGTVNFGGVKLYLGYDNTAETFSGTFNGTPTAVYYDSTANWTVTSASVPFNAILQNTGLVIINSIHGAHGTGLSSLSNFTLTGGGFSTVTTTAFNGYTLDSASGGLIVASAGVVVGSVLVEQGLLNIEQGGNVDGPVTLIDGTAAVNGTLGRGYAPLSGSTLYGAYVGQNAYLHGNGTIMGDLINAGRLSPGNSPGTLHVNGNFTQTSTGTLIEDLQSTTVYDRLIVKGTAKLGGNVQLNYVNNFKATPGESFTILTAVGGVTGTFNLLDPHATGTLLSLGLVYQSNDVLLTFVQGSFAGLSSQFTLTPNQLSVARGLDNLAGNQPKSGLIAYLDNLKLASLPTQLESLSPSGLASIFEIGIATESVQSSNIQRRLQDIRNGATGFSSSGANITDSHGTLNFDSLPLYGAEVPGNEAKYTPEGKGTEAKGTMVTNTANNRWGTFIAGSGEFTKIDGTSDVKGSDFTTGGVTLGLDYRVSKNLAVGAMAGYANTSSGSAANGAVDVNGGKGGVYATWFNDGYYVDSSFTLGGNSYDTTRDTVGGTARGSTSGLNWNGLIGGGYDRKSGSFSYGPVASVQYTHVGFDQFTETGSLAALTFPNQSEDSLRTQVGVHGSYILKLGSHTFLTPDVRVQWQHEFMDSTASLASRFAGETSTFTVSATQLKRDSLWVDAGATLEFSPAFSIFAYYTGDVGRTNYSSNAVSGGVRINF